MTTPTDLALIRLGDATRALAEVSNASEAWQLVRTAEAARQWAQMQSMGHEAINYATAIKAKAMLLLADFVDAGQADGTIRTKDAGRPISVSASNIYTLPELLETDPTAARQAVHQARRLRDALDGADIDVLVAEANAAGEDLGIRGLRMAAAATRVPEPEPEPVTIPADISTVATFYTLAVANLHTVVEPESIDWIVTDPPYGREYLSLYGELAEFAAHALRPGGGLLAMSGQSWLPTVIELLSAHLTYHWTLAYLTPGGQAPQIFPRRVNTFWKPVLWYVRDGHDGGWIGDVVQTPVNDNDKRFHHWGQGETGFYKLMEKFVRPGQVVCDPFLGGGTTGAAALLLGAQFIGSDIDSGSVQGARERIASTGQT